MDELIPLQSIVFPNGNRAQMMIVPSGTNAATIAQRLDVKPDALIVLIGGASGLDQLDEERQARLFQLFNRGIARAAQATNAAILDGGTDSGIMAMIGKGFAERQGQTALIGVAPLSKVTYPDAPLKSSAPDIASLDQNHTHFVLVQADAWGGESSTIAALAKEFSQSIPVIAVIANGGEVTKSDLLYAVRNNLPIIIIEQSGRLADEVAALWKTKQTHPQHRAPFIADPVMAEIIADGNIRLFSIDDTPEELARSINQNAGSATLQMAWSRFALYDYNATIYQKEFRRLQIRILVLSVFTTALALSISQFQSLLVGLNLPIPFLVLNNLQIDWSRNLTVFDLLHHSIVALPILITVFIAFYNRFNPGNKYILMRAAAERVKRELYGYRTRAGIYSDAQLVGSRDSFLQQRVERIARELMQTEVKDIAMYPYEGPLPPKMFGAEAGDDGLSWLSMERYDEIRLGEQIEYHRLRVGKLGASLKRMQRLTYLIGGLGSFLAAIGLELWIALTSALVAAITTYLQYTQTEFAITRSNQLLTDLQNVRAYWRALSPAERADPKKIDGFVETTEKILADENAAWVRLMGDALAHLRAEQSKQDKEQNQEGKAE